MLKTKLSKGEGVIYEFVSIVNFCSPLKFSRLNVTFLNACALQESAVCSSKDQNSRCPRSPLSLHSC